MPQLKKPRLGPLGRKKSPPNPPYPKNQLLLYCKNCALRGLSEGSSRSLWRSPMGLWRSSRTLRGPSGALWEASGALRGVFDDSPKALRGAYGRSPRGLWRSSRTLRGLCEATLRGKESFRLYLFKKYFVFFFFLFPTESTSVP